MTAEKKKLLQILFIFIALVIIISVIYLAFFQKTSKTTDKTKVAEKTIEKQTLDDVGIVYIGIDKLYDTGLSDRQAKLFKAYFKAYSNQNKQYIKKIEINESSIIHNRIKENKITKYTLKFEAIINESEKTNVILTYDTKPLIDFKLYNSDSKLIYTSAKTSGD